MKIAAARVLKEAPRLVPPDGLYDEFSARFPYEETEDQQNAIDAVLDDLGTGRPMDRLVCGDVGFGKTEVALRAAFVTAMSGKQVAVVVPTTLLARQHYQTFSDRFRGLPLNDRPGLALRAERRDEEGQGGAYATASIDIVVGTHALLGKAIAVQGSRPHHRRRGAAFRRRPQGAPEGTARRGPRPDALGDADSAHAAARPDRRARALAHHDAAGRPAGGAHFRDAVRSAARARGAAARALSRRASVLRRAAHRGHRARSRRSSTARCRRRRSPSRTARWRRASSRT